MAKYILKASVTSEELEQSGAFEETGLVDEDGRKIYRLPDPRRPIGFHWD